jgi:hypothetical protein
MRDISPLQHLLLRVLRISTLAAAVLLVMVMALNIWQKTRVAGFKSLAGQDWSFIALLAVMILAALWLYRAIGREMNNPGA